MQKIPLYKQLLSYVYPVKIKKGSSEQNPVLELFLNCGQWQLATEDAIYSDGDHYRPLVKAFRRIEHNLPSCTKVLVLGAGLGSALQILNAKGCHPLVTLVDYDALILEWLTQCLTSQQKESLEVICEDAKSFVFNHTGKYTIVVVDIFTGRIVPTFVEQAFFLEKCKQKIAPGGSLVLNYIINDTSRWEAFRAIFYDIFPGSDIIDLGVNRVLIATA